MLIHKRLFSCVCALCMYLASTASLADILLDTSGGLADPSLSSYEYGGFFNGSVGFSRDGWQFRAGFMYLGEFDLETTDKPAHITVRAPYMEVLKSLDVNVVKLEFGAGLAYTLTKMDFYDRNIDEDKETRPFVELAVVKDLNRLFSLKAGYIYMDDVSGSNISAYSLGFRFSFR